MAEVNMAPSGWHEGMNYWEEKECLDDFLHKLRDFKYKEDNKLFASFRERNTIAWKPEYDDMLVSWWTPKEIKKFEAEGKSKKEMAKMAEADLRKSAGVIYADNHWMDYVVKYSDESPLSTKGRAAKDFDKRNLYDKDRLFYAVAVLRSKNIYRQGFRPVDWEYPDLVEKANKRAEERKREEAENDPVNKMLKDSLTGRQALGVLEKSGYSVQKEALEATASSINPEKKEIVLNSGLSAEANALSLVNAAAVLKQEAAGVGNSAEDMKIRRADALTAQVCFAVEMKQKNPKILEIFKANGNTPVCEAYEQAMAETNNLNAARSAAVDCYLDAAMPDNKPSVEKIAAICKTSNGKSYYAEPVASPVKTDTNIFEEPAFNTAFKRGKKQSLYDEASFNTAFAAKAKRQGR